MITRRLLQDFIKISLCAMITWSSYSFANQDTSKAEPKAPNLLESIITPLSITQSFEKSEIEPVPAPFASHTNNSSDSVVVPVTFNSHGDRESKLPILLFVPVSSLPSIQSKPIYTIPVNNYNDTTVKNINSSQKINNLFVSNFVNQHFIRQISDYQTNYLNQYNKMNVVRYNVYRLYNQNSKYLKTYQPWYQRGFAGGYRYPILPVFSIASYFSYPAVYWFFEDKPLTSDYYSKYYPDQPLPPDNCRSAFPYKNLYFPTTRLRDLLVEVSGIPLKLRCNFRGDIIRMTKQLKHTIEAFYQVELDYKANDIVINYFQTLANKGVFVAGFISHGQLNVPFEALFDLQDPKNSLFFAPMGDKPTDVQLQLLNQINTRVSSLGGQPVPTDQIPSLAAEPPAQID